MKNRRKSREVAMKLLFECNLKKENYKEVIEVLKENEDDMLESSKGLKDVEVDENDINLKEVDMEYLIRVLKGVEEKKEFIDEKIQLNLRNWKLNRLSNVDLSILRLATYEIFFEEDIPNNVSINEAVELSKKFSDPKSSAFINAVLNSISK